jgi:hypothetical protein
MKIYTVLIPILLLAGCGRTTAPVVQQQNPAAQQQSSPPGAPPSGVAQEPSPAANASQTEPQIAIPEGTQVRVRLNQTLDTRHNHSGDRFTASLAAPIQDNGRVVVPKGTVFTGHVTISAPSGRMKGRAVMGLTLDSFEINGARYPVVTSSTSRVSAAHKKRNMVLIGGGSGLGALIGGLAGGGKGALIGAGASAAAGTAGAAATGKEQVSIPAETLLTLKLEENVEL